MEKPSLAMPGNKILFVDDETDVLKSIERELSPLKLELFLAPSAVKGLDILEGEKIDIVASDLHMPEPPPFRASPGRTTPFARTSSPS